MSGGNSGDDPRRPDALHQMRTLAEGASAPKLEGLSPGQVFAQRYQVEALIGEGGTGLVYRATDQLARRSIALKLLKPRGAAGEALERLIAEAMTARDIRHPNIVAVYDVGAWQGVAFIIMEHLSGRTLRGWMNERLRSDADISFAQARAILLAILDALEAAHALGVVHRDLKPENVFLTAEPEETLVKLKLLDFGLARLVGGVSTGQGSLSATGTPFYMAPEQITAPDTVKPSADLYSLSVMFYELLVGVLPQGHWQPPSRGRSDVPEAIDKLIEAGLSNRPRLRPQSVADYRAAVAGLTADPAALGRKARDLHDKAIEDGKDSDDPVYVEVVRLLTQAAEGGDLPSMNLLGEMQLSSYGGYDPASARAWFRKSAEAGNPEGMGKYASELQCGDGGDKDHKEALKWFRKGADAGDRYCMYELADALLDGDGMPPDPAGARRIFLQLANEGDGYSAISLADMMLSGNGGPKDIDGARRWLEKTAQSKDGDEAEAAAEKLAELNAGSKADEPSYALPEDDDADYVFADGPYYRKQGDQLRAGGKASKEDLVLAREAYETGVEKGDVPSMTRLAQMMRQGEGGPADEYEAVMLLVRACEAGDLEAVALRDEWSRTYNPSPAVKELLWNRDLQAPSGRPFDPNDTTPLPMSRLGFRMGRAVEEIPVLLEHARKLQDEARALLRMGQKDEANVRWAQAGVVLTRVAATGDTDSLLALSQYRQSKLKK